MKSLLSLCLAATFLVAGTASANADLAKQKNCMACHAANSKIIGPSFKDIAAKYGADKSAEDTLVQKVLKGSSGVWGSPAVMPANPQVSEAEARTLVKWILSQK